MGFYETEVPKEQSEILTWEWTERGGGSGVADFARRDVTMKWNEWRFAVDVETKRERDGRLGATVSKDEPGLELEQKEFYADDPSKRKWWEKFEVGIAGATATGSRPRLTRGRAAGMCMCRAVRPARRARWGRRGNCSKAFVNTGQEKAGSSPVLF